VSSWISVRQTPGGGRSASYGRPAPLHQHPFLRVADPLGAVSLRSPFVFPRGRVRSPPRSHRPLPPHCFASEKPRQVLVKREGGLWQQPPRCQLDDMSLTCPPAMR